MIEICINKTGCSGCPFYRNEGDLWTCEAKQCHTAEQQSSTTAPDWCPLRAGPVVARASEGES